MNSSTGEIVWSSTFTNGQHGLYIGPDNYTYQHLAPPGEKSGIYRINLNNSEIELMNWSVSFEAIDAENKLIHNFTDPTDNNKKKLGAFFMNGTASWKAEIPRLDDRTFLISDDSIIYGRINRNQIVAFQNDVALAKYCWPRLGGNNRNSFKSKRKYLNQ